VDILVLAVLVLLVIVDIQVWVYQAFLVIAERVVVAIQDTAGLLEYQVILDIVD
jgi:hypothetical protein